MSFSNPITIKTTKDPSPLSLWWRARSPMEKIGVGATVSAGALAATALLFPGVAQAALGGALTATGGYLLKRAFGR